ncbi:hypothetical protein COJ85_26380, partial [Bacillus sp. AFS076308]
NHCVNNTIIHLTNSWIVTDSSLSTFDSSVSCLYFFESEYSTKSPTAAPGSKPSPGWGSCLGGNRAWTMMKKAPDNKNN